MKAEYRNKIRSKNMIKKAFFELLEEKEYNKITVTDIVKKADLNRSTFYAHYLDVRAITEELENEVIDKMMELLRKFEFKNFFNNPTPLLLEISRFLESKEAEYRILLKINDAEIFLKKLRDIFSNYMRLDTDIPNYLSDTKMVNLRISYFSGGIINMYQDYFNGKLDCTLNDIPLEVAKLLAMDAKELFKK